MKVNSYIKVIFRGTFVSIVIKCPMFVVTNVSFSNFNLTCHEVTQNTRRFVIKCYVNVRTILWTSTPLC